MVRKKEEIILKEPVRIRKKNLKDGNKSLYLDIYMRGIRKKEGLKLYLVPEVSAAAKIQNKNTMKLAEQMKAQRILDIQKVGMADWEKVKKINVSLLDYVNSQIAECADLSPIGTRQKMNLRVRIEEYLTLLKEPEFPLNKVDKGFCKDFIAFLRTCVSHRRGAKEPIGVTTQCIHIIHFTSIMERAVRDGLIMQNPFRLLDKREKPQRKCAVKEFLTIEELKILMKTECRYPIVKSAFLFCCFTGLRYSDMETLEWKHIHSSVDGQTFYIEKEQVKTKNIVVVPLSQEALRWMPEKQECKPLVFHGLKVNRRTVHEILQEWVKEAGITKHVTFHTSRHTTATMLLTLGANLYVVSKILGHRSIKVTEVYAKIVDQNKINTMNLVNNMFSEDYNVSI